MQFDITLLTQMFECLSIQWKWKRVWIRTAACYEREDDTSLDSLLLAHWIEGFHNCLRTRFNWKQGFYSLNLFSLIPYFLHMYFGSESHVWHVSELRKKASSQGSTLSKNIPPNKKLPEVQARNTQWLCENAPTILRTLSKTTFIGAYTSVRESIAHKK